MDICSATEQFIKFRGQRLEEGLKAQKKTTTKAPAKVVAKTKIVESKKVLKEDEDLDLDDVGIEVDADVDLELEPTVVEDGNDFEESVTDDVYFCAACDKHFIVQNDTPEQDIICPVCGEVELLINQGSAEDALEDPVNEEVVEDIMEELGDELDNIETDVEAFIEEEIEESTKVAPVFDNVPLQKGLTELAKKHINEKSKVYITSGQINESGALVLKGRMLPTKQGFTVTLEGFKKNKSEKIVVLEGRTTLFNGGRLKVALMREGKTYKPVKVGYAFLKERVNKKTGKKVTESVKGTLR